jgi:hypothetical protein
MTTKKVKPVVKQLNSDLIQSLHDDMFQQEKLKVEIKGTIHEILVDKKFQNTKMYDLMIEFVTKLQNNKIVEDLGAQQEYFLFLIIKYFTNISIADTNDFETQIKIYRQLTDLEIAQKVFKIFKKSEMDKVIETSNEMIKNLQNEEFLNIVLDEMKRITEAEGIQDEVIDEVPVEN